MSIFDDVLREFTGAPEGYGGDGNLVPCWNNLRPAFWSAWMAMLAEDRLVVVSPGGRDGEIDYRPYVIDPKTGMLD